MKTDFKSPYIALSSPRATEFGSRQSNLGSTNDPTGKSRPPLSDYSTLLLLFGLISVGAGMLMGHVEPRCSSKNIKPKFETID
ncbi:hypothetical protein GWI33_006421 [Rhynchophorus ferrugineus]|uniref:Uncharacterized protein n=1 Tax=Rhynchophorus ferrugineus TaxID=354439 RepID=A0A834ILW8_RHYFE|nr:hypothetical protein GWI33_006421 [Rhynchophorus ferrugineus]